MIILYIKNRISFTNDGKGVDAFFVTVPKSAGTYA